MEKFSTLPGIMASDSQDVTMPIKRLHSALAAAAGILLLTVALKPQIPAVGPVWEYSSLTGFVTTPNRASICYATVNGCRNEKVFAGDPGTDDSLMVAAARLGEKGWELTSVADVNANSKTERTLYFRRLQSVLNRADRPGNR